MLLRSSSAPILKSWLPNPKDSSFSSAEAEAILQLPRTKSVSLSCYLQNPSSEDPSTKKPVFSASGQSPPKPKRQSHKTRAHKRQQKPERREITATETLFSSSGLVDGGDGGGGRGSDGGDSGGSGFFEGNNHGSESTDAYYLKMIEANPGNSLVLGNYAKFLKEVRGDYAKAEEYCGRAILADPNDADALSFYADLIWKTHKNPQRAENYFDQAVKTSPDDCYVLASYAKFLWDAEDDEGEKTGIDHSRSSQSIHLHGEALTA